MVPVLGVQNASDDNKSRSFATVPKLIKPLGKQ